jgi:hypothetical protein
MFTHGDPISLEEGKGKFISFYQAGGSADPSMQSQSGSFGESRTTGARENRVFGFGCTIYDAWNGIPADLSAVADMVRGKVMAWDDLINIMPDEEQAALLCDSFAPDVIEYGFRDFPEWITDRVRTKLAASASFTQTGTTYQQPTSAPAAPASTADEAFGAPAAATPPTTDTSTETTAGGFGSVRGEASGSTEAQDPIVPTGSIPEDAAVRPGRSQAVMDAAREAVREQQSE